MSCIIGRNNFTLSSTRSRVRNKVANDSQFCCSNDRIGSLGFPCNASRCVQLKQSIVRCGEGMRFNRVTKNNRKSRKRVAIPCKQDCRNYVVCCFLMDTLSIPEYAILDAKYTSWCRFVVHASNDKRLLNNVLL